MFYDIAVFHTRLEGMIGAQATPTEETHGRRTVHQYFSRGGWLEQQQDDDVEGGSSSTLRLPAPSLTDWNLIPERLATHRDVTTRRFFSHWNSAMGDWAAAGFPPLARRFGPVRPLLSEQ